MTPGRLSGTRKFHRVRLRRRDASPTSLNPNRARSDASLNISPPSQTHWILVYIERSINENVATDATWLLSDSPKTSGDNGRSGGAD